MKRMVVATLSTAALLFVAASAHAQDAKVDKGKQVYAAQKCSVCHSIEGKGNAKGPLDGVGSKLSAEEIKQWLVDPKTMATKSNSTRKPPMKAYANLPAADLDALVAYMQSLKKK